MNHATLVKGALAAAAAFFAVTPALADAPFKNPNRIEQTDRAPAHATLAGYRGNRDTDRDSYRAPRDDRYQGRGDRYRGYDDRFDWNNKHRHHRDYGWRKHSHRNWGWGYGRPWHSPYWR